MQREVKWLGQVQYGGQFPGPCSATNPCPAGFNCVNGACVPATPQLNPNLLRNIAPRSQPATKTDNTVLWLIGGTIGVGILYYALQ